MRSTLFAAAAALLAAPAVHAQQNETLARRTAPVGVSVSTGLDYSRGDYGLGADTDILVVPFSVRATLDNFTVSASLPYLKIDGPGGVVVGPDGQPLPGVVGIPGKRSGLGDTSLGGTYTFRSSDNPMELALAGRVKFPTSDSDKRLGTGKTDVKVSADLSYALGDFVPFVTAGYRFLGDPASGELRDGPTASAGFSAPVGRNVVILSYDYARSSTPFSEDSHELFGGLSIPVGERFTITGYGVGGLSKGSPDFGVGLLLTAKIT